jgi:hypothetical protein
MSGIDFLLENERKRTQKPCGKKSIDSSRATNIDWRKLRKRSKKVFFVFVFSKGIKADDEFMES